LITESTLPRVQNSKTIKIHANLLITNSKKLWNYHGFFFLDIGGDGVENKVAAIPKLQFLGQAQLPK
jgi:hypothetical protein